MSPFKSFLKTKGEREVHLEETEDYIVQKRKPGIIYLMNQNLTLEFIAPVMSRNQSAYSNNLDKVSEYDDNESMRSTK